MDAVAPCFERLNVVRDPVARSGAVNMALDEVLLSSVDSGVILRLYAWSEPTVSFGYFESSLAAGRVARGRATVRRWTGGGIVEHGDDFTYSLCVSRACAFARLRSAESYRRVHASLALALQRCRLVVEWNADLASLPNSPYGNACFDRPVRHDLLVNGKKVAGGAQRRGRGGLLHQGSVQVGPAADGYSGWRAKLWHELPTALAGGCEDRQLTDAEILQATALASAKYASPAWTDRF